MFKYRWAYDRFKDLGICISYLSSRLHWNFISDPNKKDKESWTQNKASSGFYFYCTVTSSSTHCEISLAQIPPPQLHIKDLTLWLVDKIWYG